MCYMVNLLPTKINTPTSNTPQMEKQRNLPTIRCSSICSNVMKTLSKSRFINPQSNMICRFKSVFGSVYSLAKMRMVVFYYHTLVKFFEKSKFELSQMDTDSLYFAVGGKSVEEILKPEMRSAYYRERHLWFAYENCDGCINVYVAAKVANLPCSLKPCCAV